MVWAKDSGPRDVGHKAPNIRLKAPASTNNTTKVHIGFDDSVRREYLQGFSKRKAERRRFGLAMGEMKRKRDQMEERKERRAAMREGREAAISDRGLDEELDVPKLKAKAPETREFTDAMTTGMFGDVVSVTTTLDSLGTRDDDDEDAEAYADELAEKRARIAAQHEVTGGKGPGGKGPVDEAQRWAYSFKAIKQKIDAAPLSTKRQRAAQRNKAQAHLDNKAGGGGVGALGGAVSKQDKKSKTKMNAGSLVTAAAKTASFGKKKRTKNAKKKGG